MKSINWINVAKLVAAFAIALGAHFIDVDPSMQALADGVAIVIAQANRGLRPTDAQ